MRVHPVYTSEETLLFTYNITKRLLGEINGCYVEFGVAAGSQIGAMQQAMLDMKKTEQIFGFDSFQGIPYAGSQDKEQPGIGTVDKTKIGLLESTGISAHTEKNVFDNFKLWNLPINNLCLIKGWFQETIPNTQLPPIALMRLDGDLYESTYLPLNNYLINVVSGGVIIIDDWNLEGVRKAVFEYFSKRDIKEEAGIAWIQL